jgi:hypothetical protein
MREKQREDERIQKELRREMEQHYRHLQREAQKVGFQLHTKISTFHPAIA